MKAQKSMNRREFLKLAGLAVSTAILASCAPKSGQSSTGSQKIQPGKKLTGELEIFSWWTSGGEVEALNALYKIFSGKYPDVKVNNAALAGGQGQGGNMKALLETRMLGNKPPDSFQVHLGRELIDSHVIAGRMEPLDELYKNEGFDQVFQKDVISIASYEGHPYSVPVNIHRSNCLWYRPSRLDMIGVTEPPKTWDEFFEMAKKLKEKNIQAMAIAEQGGSGGFSGHVLENILVSVLGPDKYLGLFNGKTDWADEGVTQSLKIMDQIYTYANPDYASTSWGDINDRFVADNAPAMMLMGDWTHGVLMSKGFKDYKWTVAPGTQGYYILLSDSFGLPKGAPHRDNALAFLQICGSKDGQDAFNPIKGSISARTDSDRSKYDAYLTGAMDDFKNQKGLPSIQHGAAVKQSFLLDYDIALADLCTNHDVTKVQGLMVQAAKTAELKQ